ncbi:hypothetical protein RRG08_037539, partial [Elysia crispata]
RCTRPAAVSFIYIVDAGLTFNSPTLWCSAPRDGVPRQTEEELSQFADFAINDDPNAPYSTFNFTYTHESFQRLSQLTEYNTLKHVEDIRQVMKDLVTKKPKSVASGPHPVQDIKLLPGDRRERPGDARKLRKFITRMESRAPSPAPPLESATEVTQQFPPQLSNCVLK